MNFFKKSKKIAIIAPWELNLDVQDFALRYARAGTSIKVEMVRAILKINNNQRGETRQDNHVGRRSERQIE